MDKEKRHIAILGSTGSIGTQALEVIALNPDILAVEVLTANNNAALLIEQARQFKPNAVVIANEAKYEEVRDGLADLPIKVWAGEKALEECVVMEEIDMVLTALVGFAGLKPTLKAIKAEKAIALANKETMVVAGSIVTELARQHRTPIFPVDSEHSAIFQCLIGEHPNPIEKIYLTASGGPFRGYTREQLAQVTKAQALKHPNWEMGAKITIDSASMMNKGLEVIEAKWMFNLRADQIDVVVHPQSIIHSIVQFEDGSMKAQMGLPDMRLPIQYALCFPQRLKNPFPRFSFADYASLTFEGCDRNVFRNLQHAFDAMEKGGNMPCMLNAANEVSVQLFLEEKIGFLDIAELNGAAMTAGGFEANPDLETLLASDEAARAYVREHAAQLN